MRIRRAEEPGWYPVDKRPIELPSCCKEIEDREGSIEHALLNRRPSVLIDSGLKDPKECLHGTHCPYKGSRTKTACVSTLTIYIKVDGSAGGVKEKEKEKGRLCGGGVGWTRSMPLECMHPDPRAAKQVLETRSWTTALE